MYDLMFRATTKAAWNAWTLSVGLIDEIGPVVTTPAVLGPNGTVITLAVLDERHHVNVRIAEQDPVVLAAGGVGVEWIDPTTVNNPRRIWAGGMNYWTA